MGNCCSKGNKKQKCNDDQKKSLSKEQEKFLNEIKEVEKNKRLGILHGSPGCGKTYVVKRYKC